MLPLRARPTQTNPSPKCCWLNLLKHSSDPQFPAYQTLVALEGPSSAQPSIPNFRLQRHLPLAPVHGLWWPGPTVLLGDPHQPSVRSVQGWASDPSLAKAISPGPLLEPSEQKPSAVLRLRTPETREAGAPGGHLFTTVLHENEAKSEEERRHMEDAIKESGRCEGHASPLDPALKPAISLDHSF